MQKLKLSKGEMRMEFEHLISFWTSLMTLITECEVLKNVLGR